MASVKRIRRSLIADEVFESLRRAILDHHFSPGERLEVRKLANDFDVSLMPVRQAINRLQTLGLVEIKPRSGTFVTKVNQDELLETFDIRRALECLAVESAVVRISESQLAELHGIIVEMDEHLAHGSGAQRHDELNTLFHRRIVEIAGNGRLIEMYEHLKAHIEIASVHSRSADWLKRMLNDQDEHRRILKAIEGRDARAAVAALGQHISRAKRDLLHDLDALQQGAA